MSESDECNAVPVMFENSHVLEELDKGKEEENRDLKAFSPAIYDNSHVLQKLLKDATKQKHQLLAENKRLQEQNENLKQNVENWSGEPTDSETKPMDSEAIINGWSPENVETVKKWQRDIEHTSFIYGEVLLGVKKKLNFITVTTLILSVMSTLFAALAVTLAFLDQKWVGVAFEILILVSSAVASILSGLIPIFSLDTKLEDFTRFTEKLDNAWFIYEIELGISPEQRIGAEDFIKHSDGQYLSLMQQCPFLDVEQYNKANQSYKERLFQNTAWSKNLIKDKVL